MVVFMRQVLRDSRANYEDYCAIAFGRQASLSFHENQSSKVVVFFFFNLQNSVFFDSCFLCVSLHGKLTPAQPFLALPGLAEYREFTMRISATDFFHF